MVGGRGAPPPRHVAATPILARGRKRHKPPICLGGFCAFMSLKEAIEKFSNWRQFKVGKYTVKGYDRELKNFCLFLRSPDLEAVTINDVMDYLNGLRDLGWDHNSFITKCMALRKFFEFYRLQHFKVLDENLIPIAHKIYKIPRVATEELYQKLLRVIPNNSDPRHLRNLAIVQLLWDTGARNGEIVALNVSESNLDRMKALIRTEKSKGRRPIREIFWTGATNETLKRWIKKRAELQKKMIFPEPDALFISISGAVAGRRFNIKGVGEMLRRYSNKAGIPIINPHSFRHHLGHDIISKGGSAADVMNLLGHASLQSSSIYTMMTDRELETRYRKFKGD